MQSQNDLPQTEQEWKNLGIENNLHRFMVLRWKELFSMVAFDSWQVRTCNTLILLEELKSALEYTLETKSAHNAIKAILEEMDLLYQQDSYLTNTKTLHALLKDGILKFFKLDLTKEAILRTLLAHAKLAINSFCNYFKFLEKQIIDKVSKPDERQKIKLEKNLSELASFLVWRGFSLKFLENLFQEFLRNDIPFQDRVEKVFEKLNTTPKIFHCFFPIRVPSKKIPRKQYFKNVKITNKKDIDHIQFPDSISQNIAVVTCEALDSISALHFAFDELEKALSCLQLFNPQNKSDFNTLPDVFIQEESTSLSAQAISLSEIKIIDHLKSPNNIEEYIKKLMETFGILGGTDKEKLSATLQYHRLAVSSNTDEARLLNLWIAIENLVKTPHQNIIQDVSETVSATMVTRYCSSTFKWLVIELRKVWTQGRFYNKYHADYPTIQEKYLPLEVLWNWFFEDKQNRTPQILTDILSILDHNPLLRYRMERIQNKFTTDKKTFIKTLATHQNNIKLQIKRIYRIRNQIVHNAKPPRYMQHIIQHLHSYLFYTLQHLIRDITINRFTINEALQYRKMLVTLVNKSDWDFNALNAIDLTNLTPCPKTKITEKRIQ